jgi:exosortase
MPWLVMGLFMVPMWIMHGQNLWLQPQYQVFPLLYLVLGFLIYREVRVVGEPSDARRWVGWGVLGASGVIFAAAVLLYSPYLGQVAGILWLMGGLVLFGQTVTMRRIAAYGCLLALTIIPPELSLQLSQSLQRVTSMASSGALETFRVPHIRSGNVIEVAGRSLFVDEACSGIQSLFAALCVVVIIAVVQRLPLLLSVLSLASVPLWALTGNLIRIVAISAAHTWLKWDLTHGWIHDALGYVNFALIAAFLYLWIKVLSILLEPIPLAGESHPPAVELYNRWVQWPGERIDLLGAYSAFVADEEDAAGQVRVRSEMADRTLSPRWSRRLAWAGTACLALLGLMNVAFIFSRERALVTATGNAFDFSLRSSLPGKPAFAGVKNAWPVAEFQVIERTTDNIYGHFSHVWTISPPSAFACLASLDYPFLSYHDLSVCYRGSGWEVVNQQLIDPPAGNAPESGDQPPNQLSGRLYEMDLHRPSGGASGYVVFGLIDQRGGVVEPPNQTSLRAKAMLHLRRGPLPLFIPGFRGEGERGSALLQFQVFCEKPTTFTEEERQLVRRQFFAAFSAVRRQAALALNKIPSERTSG